MRSHRRSKTEVKIKQVKSNLFRIIPVDDLSIEKTSLGKIQLTLWNERMGIAETIDYSQPDIPPEVVREVEAVFCLDIDKAKYLGELLSEFVEANESRKDDKAVYVSCHERTLEVARKLTRNRKKQETKNR